MFLQLEKGESIALESIVGIFDIDTATVSETTRLFLRRAQDEKSVVGLCGDLPKSLLVCGGEFYDRIYLSGLSAESIRKRLDNAKGMKIFWTK